VPRRRIISLKSAQLCWFWYNINDYWKINGQWHLVLLLPQKII
jgi:hypothetical protein